MATEDPKVSGRLGEAGLPTPQFSEKGDSSTSTDVDVIVNKVVERLAPTLDQTIEKKAKSLQDKRFSQIEKELGIRSGVLAELEEQGVTIPQEVRTQMQIRELQEQINQQPTQPAQVRDDGSSQQKAAVTEAVAELNKYGLSSDDADFLNLLRGQYQNRAAFDLEVQRHIVKKIAPPKPANPADVVQPPVRSNASGVTADSIEKGYLDAIAKVPRGNTHQVSQVKAEWRKKAREAGFNLNV